MQERKIPVNCCDECGNPSFAIYINADGKLCDECEDKRRGRINVVSKGFRSNLKKAESIILPTL